MVLVIYGLGANSPDPCLLLNTVHPELPVSSGMYWWIERLIVLLIDDLFADPPPARVIVVDG